MFWKMIVQNNVKQIINLREGNAMLEENTSWYILDEPEEDEEQNYEYKIFVDKVAE